MCVTFAAGAVCKSTFRDQTSAKLNLRVKVVNEVKNETNNEWELTSLNYSFEVMGFENVNKNYVAFNYSRGFFLSICFILNISLLW